MKSEPDLSGARPPQKNQCWETSTRGDFHWHIGEKTSARAVIPVIHDAGRSEQNDWCQGSITALL